MPVSHSTSVPRRFGLSPQAIMAKLSLFVLLNLLLAGTSLAATDKKVYIVQLKASSSALSRRDEAASSLESVSASADDILYAYDTAINGYAAQISDEQADTLRARPDVLGVYQSKIHKLHTTRTPQFLGLDNAALLGRSEAVMPSTFMHRRDTSSASAESDLIIGVLDTGVWPERPSYNDDGLGPIPSRWKGECETGDRFGPSYCNKKLIGGRAFYAGYVAETEASTGKPFNWTEAGEFQSARDDDGHGTHTSSTAGGSVVEGASLFGQASGTARGVAKDARLAMYKVCWAIGCTTADILAAMDKAIEDGVNIMSLSLGGDPSFSADDAQIVGSFAAMEKGVFVAMSGGNSGPGAATVSNLAPWTLTVAASTLDRDFPATVGLGNGQNFTGSSLYSDGSVPGVKPLTAALPFIAGEDAAASNRTAADANLCLEGSLDPAKVTGKIVLCVRGNNGRVAKGGVVRDAGGSGMVLINNAATGEELIADAHILPALHLGFADGTKVAAYAKTEGASALLVFDGTRLGVPAPQMAAFSSRGPALPVPWLLKPDITGPGVSILAAWAGEGPTGLEEDTRSVNFNVISGTSMSCPHLSGVATYIMARRPSWSISAIRSAIMTTAYTTLKGTSETITDTSNRGPADPFAYGNGHVDPTAALDPGLVYETSADDYLDFLCAVNPGDDFVAQISRSNTTCDPSKTYNANHFNYPSFSTVYDTASSNVCAFKTRHKRTVTNFGGAGTYKVDVKLSDPDAAHVTVEPDTLTFTKEGEKQSFDVVVRLAKNATGDGVAFGRLTWSDGKHTVGSSMSFLWL
ncbi:PA domain-containing protein [Plectosphaerella plurivora]|uniref:PA domain-containing protein n=1 Tax=Plectosphaerella plurivora TaxID=936078 RepID=A0A9P8V8U1_9PEZI|nr:PA domain-containing protein [Plectosphaerella plurivora]